MEMDARHATSRSERVCFIALASPRWLTLSQGITEGVIDRQILSLPA